MNWNALWLKFFGSTQWLGLDYGFWISMIVVTIIVVLMNIVFWSMKPLRGAKGRLFDEEILTVTHIIFLKLLKKTLFRGKIV